MNPKVSIIIVNYNGYEETIDCLKSLVEIDYSNFNIFVIENGSSNDSFKKISDFIKEVNLQSRIKLILSKDNLGFAGGCNLGIKEAQKSDVDYFLLLNPDTKVEKGFLSKLIEVSENSQNYSELRNKKIGFLGPRIFYEDKKTVYSNGGFVNKFLISAVLKDHGLT
ncbi:MAG: glycosyltransferase, partial [Candidatus Gracilibacteria bacterium]